MARTDRQRAPSAARKAAPQWCDECLTGEGEHRAGCELKPQWVRPLGALSPEGARALDRSLRQRRRGPR